MGTIIGTILFILIVSVCCCADKQNAKKQNQKAKTQSKLKSTPNNKKSAENRKYDDDIIDVVAIEEKPKRIDYYDDYDDDDIDDF